MLLPSRETEASVELVAAALATLYFAEAWLRRRLGPRSFASDGDCKRASWHQLID